MFASATMQVRTSVFSFELVLTLPAPCISENCIKIKINVNFYFHSSLWSLKGFYEGLEELLNFYFICRMRQLDKRFESYPQQVMQCKLDGVSPISLAPNAEFVWSMRSVLESCHECFKDFCQY